MLDDQKFTISISPKDVMLYTLFCKHYDNFSSMLEAGIFDLFSTCHGVCFAHN